MFFIFLILIFFTNSQHTIAYVNNYIIGTPKVNCEENDVSLDIITAKPFEGNIFVKGRAKDSECRQSYSPNATRPYTLGLGKCGMQRLRSANPRGVNFAVTVVVSFHPHGFITKNDRAFNVKCFYLEPEEILTNTIQVSQLPTTELNDEMGMPVCEYSVHSSTFDGPITTFANVGETVVHVWECKGPSMGMLVKKCVVTDGDGDEHPVIDDNGCSTDTSLLGDIVYDGSLMKAYTTSQAFKYADSNQLYFTCQIRLCQKNMGMCDGVTPPNCSKTKDKRIDRIQEELLSSVDASLDANSTYGERNITLFKPRGRRTTRTSDAIELDVTTPQMLIMDIEDSKTIHSQQNCLSNSLMFLSTLITFGFISISIMLLCHRRISEKKLPILG